MSISHARASRIASSCPKDFDFQYFIFQNEGNYPMWLTKTRMLNWLYKLPESVIWNGMISLMALVSLITLSADLEGGFHVISMSLLTFTDHGYNLQYAMNILAHLYYDCYRINHQEISFKCFYLLGYIVDVISYVHQISSFVAPPDIHRLIKLFCYYIRMHRPFRFLWGLREYNLRGDVFGTLLKYIYFFTTLRVVYVNFFLWIDMLSFRDVAYNHTPSWIKRSNITKKFFHGFFVVSKLFLSTGPDVAPVAPLKRLAAVSLMISGCLIVSGITVASMALVVGIYMRPEEVFRARFRIIMQDMEKTHVPAALRDKVETFYRMYWHKQKAVSRTQLMMIFPPTLKNAIGTDIFFEGQQKSRVLCDLSYQFLTELGKTMKIINYVPGDTIIKRNSPKDSMVYISFGDVEMLTAEDDDTPILRLTRGSVLNPCGMCAEVASSTSHVSIRAATFCCAHVLTANDMWRVTAKHGKTNGQAFIMHSSFEEHFEKVKRHYAGRMHPPVKYKSSILMMKRNLMALKEARNPEGKLLLARNDMFLEISGCYIMRNHDDTALMSQEDPICLRPTFPCILQPTSSLLIAWHILVGALTLAVVVIYPIQLMYVKTISKDFKFFDYMVTLVFLVDIVVSLSTGTKLEEGVPITFTQTAAKNIRSTWFAVDLLAVVPIFEFVTDGRFSGINKLFKLIKVFRLMKQMENVFLFTSNTLRFLAYVLLTASTVILIGAMEQCYLCFTLNKCRVKNFTTLPYWVEASLDDNVVAPTLVYSWFWAVCIMSFTTHKTGRLAKYYPGYQVYMMGLMEILCIIHIMVEATFSATIMVTTHMRYEFNTCIDTVKNFFVKNNVDPILRHRFICYLKLCWYTDKAYSITHEKKSILFDLPIHVYQEIMALQRNKYLLCIPCMKLLHKEELKKLSAHARMFYTSPNEILQNTGEISNEIYVIRQGICEMINPMTKKVNSLLTAKNYFGDVECIMRLPSFYTVRAVTHVQIFSISRKHIIRAIAIPRIIDAIRYVRQLPEFAQLQTRRESFLHYEMPPPVPNREFFPLPRKHDPDVAFLQPFSRLGFFSLLRYIFPRFTIRPDSKYLKRYEWFRATCAIISGIVFPVYTVLVLQYHWMYYLTLLLDISAYLDIIQRMLVSFYNDKGILIYHPASTSSRYIKGAFIVDLMSSLPLESLDSMRASITQSKDMFKIPPTLQILMFNRLGQLYRVPNAMDILNDYFEREDIILLIKSLPTILALLSVMTAMILESSVKKYRHATGGFYRFTLRDGNKSWISVFSDVTNYNPTASAMNLILTCFYWATYEVTTVGLDKYQPTKFVTLVVIMTGMLIGIMLTTYIGVAVLSIRSNVNQELASYQGHLKDMKWFMERERLDKALQIEVISYFEYKWDKTGGTDYRSVLKLCDQITLRTDAILHIYGQTFSKCPLLYKCDVSLLRIMGRAVYSVYYRDHMTIIERDEVISDMYIVDYGSVELRHPRDDNHIITKLPRGSMFGNLNNVKYVVNPNKFVASANLHLLKINAEMFFKIIADFPSVKVLLMKFRPNEENYIIGSLRDQSVVASTWRDRAMSSPIIVVSKEGMLKYFHVHGKAVQIYLIIISTLCVYGDMYNAGFHVDMKFVIGVLYFLDVCFLVKIILNYTMPYVTDEETDSRVALVSSRKRYYKGEFRFDLLSILPLELFAFLHSEPWSIFPFLRLNRIFRMTTVYNCLQRYHQKLFINLTVTTISSVFIWFTLFIHASSCIWHYQSIGKGFESWKYGPNNESVCQVDYVCSIYFIISTFTQNGVGDILPRTQTEVFFVCILMLCSMMIYMIYVGEFSNIIQYQSFRVFNYYSKYLELQDYLSTNRVSNNLMTMTKKYTLFMWRESRGYQTPYFLETAPQSLRLKIMSAAYLRHLAEHPTFQYCEPSFLRHLAGCLKPFLYVEDMWVVKDGEITNSMYFVHRGRVQELDEEMERDLQVFYPGQFFGTAHGLFHDVPYNLSYKTLIKSQILTLTLDDWHYLLNYFPTTKDIIYQDKEKGKVKDFSQFIPGAEDDKGDKDKKRVQITKAPTVHTLKGLESQIQIPEGPSPVAAAGPLFAGIPSGRDSDTPVPKATQTSSDKSDESPWPLHSRRRSSTSESKEATDTNGDFPKLKSHFARRQSTIENVDKDAVNKELLQLQSQPSSTTDLPVSREENKNISFKSSMKQSLDRQTEEENDSLWPVNNKRKSSGTSEDATERPSIQKKEMKEISKLPSGRRKSTVLGIDKEAINKELDSIKLSNDLTDKTFSGNEISLSPEMKSQAIVPQTDIIDEVPKEEQKKSIDDQIHRLSSNKDKENKKNKYSEKEQEKYEDKLENVVDVSDPANKIEKSNANAKAEQYRDDRYNNKENEAETHKISLHENDENITNEVDKSKEAKTEEYNDERDNEKDRENKKSKNIGEKQDKYETKLENIVDVSDQADEIGKSEEAKAEQYKDELYTNKENKAEPHKTSLHEYDENITNEVDKSKEAKTEDYNDERNDEKDSENKKIKYSEGEQDKYEKKLKHVVDISDQVNEIEKSEEAKAEQYKDDGYNNKENKTETHKTSLHEYDENTTNEVDKSEEAKTEVYSDERDESNTNTHKISSNKYEENNTNIIEKNEKPETDLYRDYKKENEAEIHKLSLSKDDKNIENMYSADEKVRYENEQKGSLVMNDNANYKNEEMLNKDKHEQNKQEILKGEPNVDEEDKDDNTELNKGRNESASEEYNTAPTTTYSRRKSTFYGVDKEATDKELKKLESTLQISDQPDLQKDEDKIITTENKKLDIKSLELQSVAKNLRKSLTRSVESIKESIHALKEKFSETLLSNTNIKRFAENASTDEIHTFAGEDKDALLLEQDEITTKELLEKIEKSQADDKKSGQQGKGEKPRTTNFNLQPLERPVSDLFLETYQEPKEKRSALSFKDTIETVEIPKDERMSIIDKHGNLSESRIQSLISFVDDIAMKDSKATSVPKEKDEVSSGSVRYGDVNERSIEDESSANISKKSKSHSVWDVEDYMENVAKTKDKTSNKATSIAKVKDVVSSGSVRYGDVSERSFGDESSANISKKSKSHSVWDVEDYMENVAKTKDKTSDKKAKKVGKKNDYDDEDEDLSLGRASSFKYLLKPMESEPSVPNLAMEKDQTVTGEGSRKRRPLSEDIERGESTYDDSRSGTSGTTRRHPELKKE